MDYLQIYKEEYKRTFEEIKSQSIKEFKATDEQGLKFKEFFINMNAKFASKLVDIQKDLEKRGLKSCLELFDRRNDFYQ
jgi:hypothetical protein